MKTARPIRAYTYRESSDCFLPHDVLNALGAPADVQQGRLVVFAATAKEAATGLENVGLDGAAHELKVDESNIAKALTATNRAWRHAVYALPMNGREPVLVTNAEAGDRRIMVPVAVPNYVQAAIEALNDAFPGLEPDLARLYTLLVLVKGEQTTLEDVHQAWAVWRNITNPAHRSLIPFSELSSEVQEMDREYMDAIHVAARAVS